MPWASPKARRASGAAKRPDALAKLTEQQRRRLPELLLQRSVPAGLTAASGPAGGSPMLSIASLACLMPPPKAGRILRSSGQSPQQPALRAAQRDEWAVAEGRTTLWADGSAFYSLQALLRTWAPAAQTPAIRRKPALTGAPMSSGFCNGCRMRYRASYC